MKHITHDERINPLGRLNLQCVYTKQQSPKTRKQKLIGEIDKPTIIHRGLKYPILSNYY